MNLLVVSKKLAIFGELEQRLSVVQDTLALHDIYTVRQDKMNKLNIHGIRLKRRIIHLNTH